MMPMSLNELTTVIRPRGQESLVAENTGVRSGAAGPPRARPYHPGQWRQHVYTSCEGSKDNGGCVTGPGLRAHPSEEAKPELEVEGQP